MSYVLKYVQKNSKLLFFINLLIILNLVKIVKMKNIKFFINSKK